MQQTESSRGGSVMVAMAQLIPEDPQEQASVLEVLRQHPELKTFIAKASAKAEQVFPGATMHLDTVQYDDWDPPVRLDHWSADGTRCLHGRSRGLSGLASQPVQLQQGVDSRLSKEDRTHGRICPCKDVTFWKSLGSYVRDRLSPLFEIVSGAPTMRRISKQERSARSILDTCGHEPLVSIKMLHA